MRASGLKPFCQCHENLEAAMAPEAPAGGGLTRREFLQGSLAAAGLSAAAAIPAAAAAPAAAQSTTPIGAPWWPSRWGPDDEAGASNWITPEKVLAAAALIRTGRIYEMGRVAQESMPMFGDRDFVLRIVGSPSGGPLGANRIVWNDEFLSTEIGQVGTCLDGLGHIGCAVGGDGDTMEMRFYNGFTQKEMVGTHGLTKLGIEKVKPFFTRGVLIDVAALKGRMLDKGEEITVADLRACLARQRIAEASFRPGDAVFFRTGWGDLWLKDDARYNDGEPGIGVEVAKWISSKQLALVGADNWGCEVVPNPDPKLAFPAHHELITRHGIFIHEGMDLDPLARDGVHQFAFVLLPLAIKGATGSISRPVAIA